MNMKNTILKSGVMAVAVATLLASGTTDPVISAQAKNYEPVYSALNSVDRAKKSSEKVEFSKSGDDITLKIGSSEYKLSAADKNVEANGEIYYLQNKGEGDSHIVIKNYSTEKFEKDNHKTANVSLWFLKERKKGGDQSQNRGYFIDGSPTTTVPADLKATYNGKMHGYSYVKAIPAESKLAAEYRTTGDVRVDIDLSGNNSIVTGLVDNIKNYHNVNSVTGDFNAGEFVGTGRDVKVFDGAVDGSTFSASVAAADDTSQAANPLTGEISGGFFGANAEEIAGTGLASSTNGINTFGFTAKQ